MDIYGKNEGQNIEECSEVKLQTSTAHSAHCTSQAHFFLPKPISFNPIPSHLAQTKAQCNYPFFFFLFFSFPFYSPLSHHPLACFHLPLTHLSHPSHSTHPIPHFLPCYQPPYCQPLPLAHLSHPSHSIHPIPHFSPMLPASLLSVSPYNHLTTYNQPPLSHHH